MVTGTDPAGSVSVDRGRSSWSGHDVCPFPAATEHDRDTELDRAGRGPARRGALPGGRGRPRDADLRQAPGVGADLGRPPGPGRATVRGPDRGQPGRPARLRHRPGQHPGRRAGGGPAGPCRPGRGDVPAAGGGPAGRGRVRRRLRAAGPGATRPAGRDGGVRTDPGRGNLPVHQRDHGDAQGDPARRGSAEPRRSRGGHAPPARPGRPGLLLSPAVPRQRRGGRPAGHPGRRGLPGAGRPVQPRRQITWINAVPAIITVLAMDPPAVRPAGAAGRIRFVRSASAPLPPSALRRFEEAFGIPSSKPTE
jgi:hypothetical protein